MSGLKSALSHRGRRGPRAVALACALLLLAAAAKGQTVSFQGQTYSVQVVTLATTNVPAAITSDLIFVQTGGQKLLALPTDGTARGDYDPVNQRFYMLDRTNRQINAFASIDATLINLDGTFFSTTQQNPAFGLTPLEQITLPIGIPSIEVGTDICVIDSNNIGCRTDGTSLTDEKVYTVTRQGSTIVGSPLTVALKNADAANGNLSVFVAYDATNNSFLLSQISLDAANNASTSDRITALPLDGSAGTELILANNAALPSYVSGGEIGITVDQSTATIYLLSITATARQLLVFAPQGPVLSSLTPSSGTILGGTKVTLKGLALPPDAAPFFGGVAASSPSVSADGTTITAFTPAHAAGAVDVTVTGTGIASSAPLTLAGAFTYVDAPPQAHLSVSPSQGPPPLAVSFSAAGSFDPDGTLVSRVIDFGDGMSFVFPSDLSVVTVTHTYAAAGTYVPKLTVRDDGGLQGSDNAVIVVGEAADLVLRSLSFKAGGRQTSKDTLKLKGEIVLPQNMNLVGAEVVVGFFHPDTGALVEPQPGGYVQNAALDATDPNHAVTGGELSTYLDKNSRASTSIVRFRIAPLKKPGTAPNTFSISLDGFYDLRYRQPNEDTLDLSGALDQAVVNLSKHEDGTAVQANELKSKRVGKVVIVVRLETQAGDTLQYRKLAVVDILASRAATAKSGRTANIRLTRP